MNHIYIYILILYKFKKLEEDIINIIINTKNIQTLQ